MSSTFMVLLTALTFKSHSHSGSNFPVAGSDNQTISPLERSLMMPFHHTLPSAAPLQLPYWLPPYYTVLPVWHVDVLSMWLYRILTVLKHLGPVVVPHTGKETVKSR